MQSNETGKIYQRPWGSYQTLRICAHYQVKIITINPGGRLSLQKHAHRSEHWVVVTGQPTLTLNDQKKTYQMNDSLYIPQQAIHRIENLTDRVCEIIEVQVGDYLGEDDIVRIEDVYGRNK